MQVAVRINAAAADARLLAEAAPLRRADGARVGGGSLPRQPPLKATILEAACFNEVLWAA